jgi:hypothetical protein
VVVVVVVGVLRDMNKRLIFGKRQISRAERVLELLPSWRYALIVAGVWSS